MAERFRAERERVRKLRDGEEEEVARKEREAEDRMKGEAKAAVTVPASIPRSPVRLPARGPLSGETPEAKSTSPRVRSPRIRTEAKAAPTLSAGSSLDARRAEIASLMRTLQETRAAAEVAAATLASQRARAAGQAEVAASARRDFVTAQVGRIYL